MKRFKQFLAEKTISPSTYNLPQLFDVLNHQLFGGELPRVPVSFQSLPKGQVGVTQALAHKMGRQVTYKLETAKIMITPRAFEEDVLKGILAHEMIHLYLMNKHNPEKGHGIYFKSKLYQIQSKAKFKIPISHEISPDELQDLEHKEVSAFFVHQESGQVNYVLNAIKGLHDGLVYAQQTGEFFIKNNINMSGGLITKVEYGSLKSALPHVSTVQRGAFHPKAKFLKLTASQYTDLMKNAKFRPIFSISRKS